MTQWRTEICCKCNAYFAITTELYNIARERCEQMQFYCPHGHPQHYVRGESERDKLRRERDRAVQQQARLQSERDAALRQAEKLARSIKRAKKQASAQSS